MSANCHRWKKVSGLVSPGAAESKDFFFCEDENDVNINALLEKNKLLVIIGYCFAQCLLNIYVIHKNTFKTYSTCQKQIKFGQKLN